MQPYVEKACIKSHIMAHKDSARRSLISSTKSLLSLSSQPKRLSISSRLDFQTDMGTFRQAVDEYLQKGERDQERILVDGPMHGPRMGLAAQLGCRLLAMLGAVHNRVVGPEPFTDAQLSALLNSLQPALSELLKSLQDATSTSGPTEQIWTFLLTSVDLRHLLQVQETQSIPPSTSLPCKQQQPFQQPQPIIDSATNTASLSIYARSRARSKRILSSGNRHPNPKTTTSTITKKVRNTGARSFTSTIGSSIPLSSDQQEMSRVEQHSSPTLKRKNLFKPESHTSAASLKLAFY